MANDIHLNELLIAIYVRGAKSFQVFLNTEELNKRAICGRILFFIIKYENRNGGFRVWSSPWSSERHRMAYQYGFEKICVSGDQARRKKVLIHQGKWKLLL